MRIDIFSSPNSVPYPRNQIYLPLANIGDSLASMGGKPLTSLNDYVAGKVAVNSKLLSRLIFENLSLNLYLSMDKQISLHWCW